MTATPSKTKENKKIKASEHTSTFINNMKLPVHGWFRFPAGFSAEWVKSVVENELSSNKNIAMLDPFAGVATSILAGEEAGISSIGLEAQSFTSRIAQAKLLWSTNNNIFLDFAAEVIARAKSDQSQDSHPSELIQRCYSEDSLKDLMRLKRAWELSNDGSPSSKLTWLALTITLRTSSSAGTAPWQYILPDAMKQHAPNPYDAFTALVQKMASDMNLRQFLGAKPIGKVILADARNCYEIKNKSVDLVITSPPYMNNYDYADATRLEMTFWGEIKGWGELHEKVRKNLIMSSSQHASAEESDLAEHQEILSTAPFADELHAIYKRLSQERLSHGGKKAYHLMINGYFADMSLVWKQLRRVCKDGSKVCFVIGDSAPYGIYVPVDQWMGELALEAGFKSFRFEKLRDRNTKWKNRKHTVPLKEGNLWVQG